MLKKFQYSEKRLRLLMADDSKSISFNNKGIELHPQETASCAATNAAWASPMEASEVGKKPGNSCHQHIYH